MKKSYIRNLFLLLMFVVGSVAVYAQEFITVGSLSEAKNYPYYENLRLELPKDKVQLLYKDGSYVYLWDGTDGLQLSVQPQAIGLDAAELGQYVNGVVCGMCFGSGNHYLFLSEEAIAQSSVTLGVKAPLVPKNVASLDEMQSNNVFDYIKVEGDIEGYNFISGNTTVALPQMDLDKFCDFNVESYEGSHGYMTAMYWDNWGSKMLKPLTTDAFAEVVEQIKTQYQFDAKSIAEFKTLSDEYYSVSAPYGVMGKLRFNSKVQIMRLAIVEDSWSTVDLWDGNDAIRLQGTALYDVFKDAKVGQHVKGYLVGQTFGSSGGNYLNFDYWMADNYQWYSDDAAKITLGEVEPLVAKEITFNELKSADLKKAVYDYSYIKVVGVPYIDGGKSVYLYSGVTKQDSISVRGDYFVPTDTAAFDGKKGVMTGMLNRNALFDGYELYLMDDKFFEALPVTTYDLEAKSIAQYKELNTEWGKMVKLSLNGAQLIYKDEYGYNFILWDGSDGLKLQGGENLVKLLGSAAIGQRLDGYIIGMMSGNDKGQNNLSFENYNVTDGVVWEPLTAAEVSFGKIAPIRAGYAEFEEVDAAKLTSAYNYSYLRFKARFTTEITEFGSNCYMVDANDVKYKLSSQLYAPKDTVQTDDMGYISVLCEVSQWDTENPYTYYIINDNYFTPLVSELVLDANADNSGKLNDEFRDVKVVINNLDIKQGQWNAVCLPMSMTSAQIDEVFGADSKVYCLTAKSEVKGVPVMEFAEVAERQMIAGQSYLVKPVGGVQTIEVEGVNIMPDVQPTVVADDYKFEGSYANMLFAPRNCNFYLGVENEDARLIKAKSGEAMSAFSAYFTTPEGIKDMYLKIDDVLTGIGQVDTLNEVVDGKVYNIQGRYLGTSLEGLDKGVYIVNGKKVVVK